MNTNININEVKKIASTIEDMAKQTKYNLQMYEVKTDVLSRFLRKIMALDVFAAKVAETVEKNCGCGFYVAKVSGKQAWCIACAAVENNIELNW